jgi:hypothetical protein
MVAGLAVPLAVGLGSADAVAPLAGDPDDVAVPLADGPTRCAPADVMVGGAESNSVLLAGTSSANEAKISLSSGCVHSTLAVSPGTASPRGKLGIVKKAILSDGIERSDCPRFYRPVIPPSWLSIVNDLVAASRNR